MLTARIQVTWKDVDTKARRLNVDHQLIYKNLGDGCRFHISTPKTDSGIRVIPMTQEVQKAFEEQRKINFMLAKDKSIEVDGYSGFVFTAKSGRPLMPYGVNSVLYNIVDAYNKEEVQKAKKEHRKAELLPKVSAHVMRHTACTRMAECRMDMSLRTSLWTESRPVCIAPSQSRYRLSSSSMLCTRSRRHPSPTLSNT